MTIISGYTLHVYCSLPAKEHEWSKEFAEYTGETLAECLKQARADGWSLPENADKHFCPAHSKIEPTSKKAEQRTPISKLLEKYSDQSKPVGIAIEQAADLLNVSLEYVKELIKQKKILANRKGNERFVRLKDVFAYKKELEQLGDLTVNQPKID